jgi:feruloyl esterase
VPPLATIAYFNAVLKATGESRRGTAIELYMEPGVNHCWGGDGPDTFDALGVLDQWIRSGRAPARITALHTSDTGIARTMPLCPYPQVAQYAGNGSVERAESFRCTTDVRPPAQRATSTSTSSRRTATR